MILHLYMRHSMQPSHEDASSCGVRYVHYLTRYVLCKRQNVFGSVSVYCNM
jgi:hypothetical protein